MIGLVRRQARIAMPLGVAVVALALIGCAPQLSSPIGLWRAAGDDEGTLVINADGTFAADHVSYDLVHDRDSENDFSAEGTWRLVRGGAEIKLHVVEAERAGFDVGPASFSVGFVNGVIRFTDPDETVGIEFRIEDSAE
ncbi:hypothetical protein [Microbacterium sp. CGR1]|uniref:hypothetical protein n=1 Tax=Microbacterium sp. CGR1 TaxID=1696072 RepID=UPI003DA1DE1D